MKKSQLLIAITSFTLLIGASCPPVPIPIPTPVPTVIPTPVPTPTSSPSPLFCPDPPVWGDPLGKTVKLELRLALEAKINTAMTQLGYTDEQVLSGDCNVAAELFYSKLQAQVRSDGSCAYHVPDAFHIVTPNGCVALDHHMINFGGCKVRFASEENYKGDWEVNTAICGTFPEPTPAPTITPIPSPTPITNNCPVTVNDQYFTQCGIGRIGTSQQYTVTAKYCGLPLRNDVFGNCGTKCCTLGVDGGEVGLVCEKALFGPPIHWDVLSGDVVLVATDNPFNIKVASGSGAIRAVGTTTSCPIAIP